jgi:hypothetical protein
MTPIQQLIRVAERNTEIETGMWVTQNLRNLLEREKKSFSTFWEMSKDGKSFEECYESLMNEKYENNLQDSIRD